jgi:hypothetical protein
VSMFTPNRALLMQVYLDLGEVKGCPKEEEIVYYKMAKERIQISVRTTNLFFIIIYIEFKCSNKRNSRDGNNNLRIVSNSYIYQLI